MSTDGTWGAGTPEGVPPSNENSSGTPAAVAGTGFGAPPFGLPGAGSPVLVPPSAARPRQRPPVLIITAVVVVALVLVGVPVLVFALRSSPAAPHRTAAGSSPSASPSPTPASPEQYQKVLDGLAGALADDFTALSSIHTARELGPRLESLRAALDSAGDDLSRVVPPGAVRAAHDQLVSALRQLTGVVNEAASGTNSQALCGGSSALSRISSSPAADAVRTAVKGLATADPAHRYTVGAFVPAAVPEANRQLGNGTVIKKGPKGPNVLKVEDKFPNDLVVSLAPANSTSAALMVYVRAGATATANGVKDGTYDVYMTGGHDWDSGAKAFTRDCVYQKLEFSTPTTFTSTRTTYAILTLTLGSDTGGSGSAATATDTDPDGFPT